MLKEGQYVAPIVVVATHICSLIHISMLTDPIIIFQIMPTNGLCNCKPILLSMLEQRTVKLEFLQNTYPEHTGAPTVDYAVQRVQYTAMSIHCHHHVGIYFRSLFIVADSGCDNL